MPQPLKHKKSRQTHRKEGVKPDPTAKARVRAWRERRANKAAEAEYKEKQDQQRARYLNAHPWLPEFFTMIGIDPMTVRVSLYAWRLLGADLVTLRKAWKRAATATHPDRGGDPAKAARLNELWGQYQKLRGCNHAS